MSLSRLLRPLQSESAHSGWNAESLLCWPLSEPQTTRKPDLLHLFSPPVPRAGFISELKLEILNGKVLLPYHTGEKLKLYTAGPFPPARALLLEHGTSRRGMQHSPQTLALQNLSTYALSCVSRPAVFSLSWSSLCVAFHLEYSPRH